VISGIDLSQVIIVDNQFQSFALQPDNGIPISSYFYDPADSELRCLADYLVDKLVYGVSYGGDEDQCHTDIREINRQQFKL